MNSASQLNTRVQNQTFSPRSLLQHDCMTQRSTSSWLWRLLDTPIQKVFVLTQGHLKPSIKQCQTCSAKKTCIQHPILPENLNPLKFVIIQGRSSTAEFSNITSTIIPASFAFHSCSSVTININSHTYMYIASCTPTCFTCTLTHSL